MSQNKYPQTMKYLILATALTAGALTFVLSGQLRTFVASVAVFSLVLFSRAYLVPVKVRKDE